MLENSQNFFIWAPNGHFITEKHCCDRRQIIANIVQTLLQVDTFIPELQKKCAAAAKSGKCFHEPVEEMIGDVKVSIGFSRVGITTAKIL